MALLKPVTDPCSQKFGNRFDLEPIGYFTNAADGRPLKVANARFTGSSYAADFHRGVDVYGPLGTPLAAMEAGKVTYVDRTGGYFRVAIQGHPNVYWSLAHCDTIKVNVGDTVKRGQIVATMGRRGNVTGVHVHIMVEIVESVGGVSYRMYYDAARFLPAGSYRMGAAYGGGIVPGGDLAADDRIYPIHNVVVSGPGTNVRSHPDAKSAIVATTTGPVTVPQLNVVVGGTWTVGSVTSDTWAKIKWTDGSVAYVATALIKPV